MLHLHKTWDFQGVFLIILSLFANLIFFFLSYVMFDQQLQITFKKSSGPTEKIHSPLFTHSSLKINSNSASPSLFANIKIFSPRFEKCNNPLPRKQPDRRTGGRSDRVTD